MKKNRKKIIGLALIITIVLISIGVFLRQDSTFTLETEGQEWTGKKEKTIKKESESIAIPGFESLTFVKNERKQSVNFYNPDINNCYFKLSILLPDGKKIWESKYIEPGNGIYEINLDRTLEEGEYDGAILKYECYTMDSVQTALNGSEIKFKLSII